MSGKIFNVGIIGYGLSAKIFHIPFVTYVPQFSLYAIVQRSPRPDNDARRDQPGAKICGSANELVEDEMVDVVIVTTPPDQHFLMTKMALEAGKHVVVEKPFAPTSKEAFELINIADQQKRLLTVYQNRRWDADFLTLSQYIESGSLGRVVDFETHFDRHRPEAPNSNSWKHRVQPGGGAIYDLGTHLMDQVVCLFGPPKAITAFIGSQRDPNPTGLEDSFTVHMHYDGMMATARASVVSPEARQLRYWVRGSKGSFKKFHPDCQEDQLKEGMRPGDVGYGVEPEDRYVVSTTTSNNGDIRSEAVTTVEPKTYADFYRKLAGALAGDDGRQLPVDPASAALVIRLVELATLSSATRRTIDV